MKGIDVSRWQGSINWNAVRYAGIEFARQNGIDVNSLLQAFGKR